MPTVKCVLRESKSNSKEGILYIRLYKNKKNAEVSLRQKIRKDQWNDTKGVVKNNHPNAMQLNILIKKKIAKYEAKFMNAYLKGINITPNEVINSKEEYSITNLRMMPLVDYVNKNIEENHYRFNTKKNYTNLVYNLKNYYPEIRLGEVNEKWIKKFYKKLLDQKLSINYIEDHMKVLRKLTRIAFKDGVLDCFPFENIKIKKQEGKREFLTEAELSNVMSILTTNTKQAMVKDVFVFACFTGLRFSDLALLRKQDLKPQTATTGSKTYRLNLRMKKTQETLGFRLPQKAVAIVDKYWNNDTPFLFPMLKEIALKASEDLLDQLISKHNAYANKLLKPIIAQAGIVKRITMHCARHTFATLGLDKEIPIQVMQKLLGHKNLRETQIYAKVLGKQMDEAMEKFDGIC